MTGVYINAPKCQIVFLSMSHNAMSFSTGLSNAEASTQTLSDLFHTSSNAQVRPPSPLSRHNIITVFGYPVTVVMSISVAVRVSEYMLFGVDLLGNI